MVFRLNDQDHKVLSALAEYRVLSVRHIALILQRNAQALRRRFRALEKHGLVAGASRGFGEGRGRPERLFSLRDAGIDALKESGVLDPDVPRDRVVAAPIRCLDHHLLVNDFRVQLEQMRRLLPEMTVRFLSPTSPFVKRLADDQPLVHERIRPDDGLGDWIEFTPDGVFAITHTELGKTLLFFIEVDMGTETLASPKRSRQDVRQKIVNYQTYFRLQRYKRYEAVWGCQLRGFRVLVVAHAASRLTALSRLVRDMPPSDFVWLADREGLLSRGVYGAIWCRGGRNNERPQSILGKRVPGPAGPTLPLA